MHLIDWFYKECEENDTFIILCEVLQRLHRAAESDANFKGLAWGVLDDPLKTLECIKELYHTGHEKCLGHATAPDNVTFQAWSASKEINGKEANYKTKDADLTKGMLIAFSKKSKIQSKTLNERDAAIEKLGKCSLLLEAVSQTGSVDATAWAAIDEAVDALSTVLEQKRP